MSPRARPQPTAFASRSSDAIGKWLAASAIGAALAESLLDAMARLRCWVRG